MIQYRSHTDLDKAAWDALLERCVDRLWYARSAVLDAASPGWDALIDEEQGALMPLPWRSRFGIHYVYQPFLLQQLGPFCVRPAHDTASAFLAALPARFKLLDLGLSSTVGMAAGQQVKCMQRWDLVLPLRGSIEDLRAAYSTNHRRSLRKANTAAVQVERAADPPMVADFLLRSEQFKRWGIDQRQRTTMERVFAVAVAEGTARTYAAIHAGRPVAVGFFVCWGGRLIFLKGLADDAGRSVLAMHALIDAVIEDHAGTDLLFDFAGSMDADLARFYAGFGAGPQGYFRALVDRTSPLIRYLRTWKHGGAAEQ